MFPGVWLAITLIHVCSPMSPEQMSYMSSEIKFNTDMKLMKMERVTGDTSSQNLLDERPSDGRSSPISSSISSFFRGCLGCLCNPSRVEIQTAPSVPNPMQEMNMKDKYRSQQMTVGMIPNGLRYRRRSPDRSDSELQDIESVQAVELSERLGCIGNLVSAENLGGSTEQIAATESSSPRPIDPIVERYQSSHQSENSVDSELTAPFPDVTHKAWDEIMENTSTISPMTSMTSSANLLGDLTDSIKDSPLSGNSPESVIYETEWNVGMQTQSRSDEITGIVSTLPEVTSDTEIDDFVDVAIMHSRAEAARSRLDAEDFVMDVGDAASDSDSETTRPSIPPSSDVVKLKMKEFVDSSQDSSGTGDDDFVLL